MNLVRLHKWLTYLLIVIPFGVLLSGGEMNPLVTVLFVTGVVASWWLGEPSGGSRGVWRLVSMANRSDFTFAVLVLVVVTAARLLALGEVRIEPLVDMVLLLTALKLFQRRTPADHVQLLALSFLMLVAGSAFTQGLAFGVATVLYVVLGTLTLAVKHLREELAAHHPQQLSRFHVAKGFLATVAGLAALVMLFSIGFFLLFPRLGFGLFNTQGRTALMTSGFSEEVELGRHGLLRSDPTVVMRVRFPGARPDELRWRAIGFDYYDGRRWRQQVPDVPSPIGSVNGIYTQEVWSGFSLRDAILQDIYLEPLDTQLLFALPGVAGVSFPDESGELPRSFWRESVEMTATGEVYLRRRGSTGVHYQAYSRPGASEGSAAVAGYYDPAAQLADWRQLLWRQIRGAEPMPDFRRREFRRLDPQHRMGRSPRNPFVLHDYYLQLPPVLDQRFRDLAYAIIGDARTPLERARRIAQHLRRNYRYTVDLPPVSRENPIESFLFETRRGHCEYFATAMTLLARAVGLPARHVNGYVGGDYNDFGDFYAVRQSHAHSWVEVWLPTDEGAGRWVTFDPTPASGLPSDRSGGLWASLLALVDSLRMFWYQHVIDYDLEAQLRAAEAVLGLERDGRSPIFQGYRATRSALRNALVLLVQFFLWLGAGFFYARRHARERPWSWLDAAIGLGWLLSAEVLVLLFWRPEPSLGAAVVAAFPPVVTVLLAWRLRLRPAEGGPQRRRGHLRPESRLFLRLVRALERAGYAYGPGDTPLALLAQAGARSASYRTALAEAVALYERCRFGREAVDGGVKALRRRVRRLVKSVRREGRG